MGTSTITMSYGTTILLNTSYTAAQHQWLFTQWTRTGTYIRSNDGSVNPAYAYGALMQFALPQALKYKKITRVDLNYYTDTVTGTVPYNHPGATIRAYNTALTGSAFEGLSYESMLSNGSLSDYAEIEQINNYAGASFPKWRTADITDMFLSNLNGLLFSCVIFATPGMWSSTAYEAMNGQQGKIGGVSSGNAAYITITYEDVDQLPPSPTYPNGNYVRENTDLLFAWTWNSSTLAVQAAVHLEYKLKTAVNWTVVSLTQTAHSYKLTGGLSQGVYEWRIKGTNDAGETSAYSSTADFTVIGKPSIPVINTPANKALTEITWNTVDQNSYDIILLDSENRELINETVASSAASYKPNMFLKGSYTVKIRVRNSTGDSSDWAIKAFSITASGPAKPSMTLYVDGPKVYVDFTPAEDISYYLIRQPEGKPEEIAQDPSIVALGRFEDTTYKFFVPYRYVLRAYAGAGYTDSDPVRIMHGVNAIVLDSGEDEMILSMSEETFLPYEEDATGDTAVYNVVGRDYPVVEHGIYDNWQFSSALYVTEAQKEKLRVLARKNEIYYRDYSGRGFPVAIQSVNFVRWQNQGYIATIQFVRVAGEELILNV